jgi:hypothetical protein
MPKHNREDMPMKKAEMILALREKEKQIKARIAKLEAIDRAKERKADTRRKILLGGFLMALAIKGDENAKRIIAGCVASLKRDSDKALFVASTEKEKNV